MADFAASPNTAKQAQLSDLAEEAMGGVSLNDREGLIALGEEIRRDRAMLQRWAARREAEALSPDRVTWGMFNA